MSSLYYLRTESNCPWRPRALCAYLSFNWVELKDIQWTFSIKTLL